jgi:hypothetical protein
MKLGVEKTAMIRVRSGVSYGLTEAMDEGHCGLPVDAVYIPKPDGAAHACKSSC